MGEAVEGPWMEAIPTQSRFHGKGVGSRQQRLHNNHLRNHAEIIWALGVALV